MDKKNLSCNLQQFRKADVDSVIDSIESAKFHQAFREAAESKRESDKDLYDVYYLMSEIMSMYFQPEKNQSPFVPAVIRKDRRSFAESDINSEALQELSNFYEEINNSELNARIADLV